jgi:hypothetical protein
MRWCELAALVAAGFFAVTWVFNLMVVPRTRTAGNIITVISWWVLLAACMLTPFTTLHLLWAFPAALLLPVLVLLPLNRL